MTRADAPYSFNDSNTVLSKHLSIIIFNYKSLIKYSKLKRSKFEKIESVELLRAIENNIILGSNQIKSNSFSVDVIEDFIKAKKFLKKDKIKDKYI